MFGFGRKEKKMNGQDIVLIKTEAGKNRTFYLIAFPSIVANDVISMFRKLEKSPFNKQEYLGDVGGFRVLTHFSELSGYKVFDELELEAQPVQIQDFAGTLLRRLERVEESGQFADHEDFAFLVGELTMLRDGSFVART